MKGSSDSILIFVGKGHGAYRLRDIMQREDSSSQPAQRVEWPKKVLSCCDGDHDPDPPGASVDVGSIAGFMWRAFAPFLCICCGRQVCRGQWKERKRCPPCASRACKACKNDHLKPAAPPWGWNTALGPTVWEYAEHGGLVKIDRFTFLREALLVRRLTKAVRWRQDG